MSRSQSIRVLFVGVFVGAIFAWRLWAEPAIVSSRFTISASTNQPPPIPYTKSPVDLFRELLAMSLVERNNFLTNRPPEMRARIVEKLKEYENLDANERESRLRATELRWYLPSLMRTPPTARSAYLTAIPPEVRKMVDNRLGQWDLLPPPLQQELLDNEQTLRFFTHIDFDGAEHGGYRRLMRSSTNHYSWEDDLARWNALPETKRQALSEQFSRFFDLTPMEKSKTLDTLSDAERLEMETTLRAFEKLPPAQRMKCIRSFKQFSNLTAQERFEFLKNAERWSKMPPTERQAWRDLVAHVPQWPPMPPGLGQPGSPPMPPLPQKAKQTAPTPASLATNVN